MGATGTATLDFGAFPGKYDTSVAVTGQAAIVSGSLVEAWIRPEATAEHSADEHMVEPLKVIAGNIVAGTGFTIYGWNTTELYERPVAQQSPSPVDAGGVGVAANYLGRVGRRGSHAGPSDNSHIVPRLYGRFTVAWAWN